MPLRIKTTRKYFECQAFSGGWIDGHLSGKPSIAVYVELGEEKKYRSSPNDDPKTEYKFFYGCTVYYGTSLENLEKEIFEAQDYNVSVVIYC